MPHCFQIGVITDNYLIMQAFQLHNMLIKNVKKLHKNIKKPHLVESELEELELFLQNLKKAPGILKTSYCKYFLSNQKFLITDSQRIFYSLS